MLKKYFHNWKRLSGYEPSYYQSEVESSNASNRNSKENALFGLPLFFPPTDNAHLKSWLRTGLGKKWLEERL